MKASNNVDHSISSALDDIVTRGEIDLLKRFIYERSIDLKTCLVNIPECGSVSNLLHLAALHNSFNIIEYLCKNGLDPNKTDNLSYTPLFYASSKGNIDAVKKLLQHKANCDLKCGKRTALMIAVQNNHLGVTKALIDHGADINLSDNKGGTALHYAICYGHLELTKYLIKSGADITARVEFDTMHRYHSLHFAILHKHPDILKYLLDKNVDPNLKTSFVDGHISCILQNTRLKPMDIVQRHQIHDKEILKILLQYGSKFSNAQYTEFPDEIKFYADIRKYFTENIADHAKIILINQINKLPYTDMLDFIKSVLKTHLVTTGLYDDFRNEFDILCKDFIPCIKDDLSRYMSKIIEDGQKQILFIETILKDTINNDKGLEAAYPTIPPYILRTLQTNDCLNFSLLNEIILQDNRNIGIGSYLLYTMRTDSSLNIPLLNDLMLKDSNIVETILSLDKYILPKQLKDTLYSCMQDHLVFSSERSTHMILGCQEMIANLENQIQALRVTVETQQRCIDSLITNIHSVSKSIAQLNSEYIAHISPTYISNQFASESEIYKDIEHIDSSLDLLGQNL